MGKACIAAAVGFVLLGGGLALGGFVALRGGVSARPEPGPLETAIARRARDLLVPGAARDARNPIASTPDAIAEGRAHFADHCASCHANDGSGRTELGRRLYPRAPDMRAAPTQQLTDGELFYLIENGIRFTGMPAWGEAGKPEESWKVVHFIRHLPKITPREIAEMQRLNPRTPRERREREEEDEFLRGGATGGPGE